MGIGRFEAQSREYGAAIHRHQLSTTTKQTSNQNDLISHAA